MEKDQNKYSPATAKTQQFISFIKEFLEESDRAAVVLGAAKIDILLHQILKKVLLPSPRGDDELLD